MMQPFPNPSDQPSPVDSSAFPQLSEQFSPGDSEIMSSVEADRVAREGRRSALQKPEQSSLYTQVVEELSSFANEMRTEFAKEIPAPFMQKRLSRDQIRRRIERMTAEERVVLSRRYGARRFAQWAMSYEKK